VAKETTTIKITTATRIEPDIASARKTSGILNTHRVEIDRK